MKRIWRNKWFVLISLWSLFWALTATKVMAAGTDVQLEKILKAGTDGLTEYFKFLVNVLSLIW